MNAAQIQTENLTLVPQTYEDVCAMIEALSDADRKQVSADWLSRLHAEVPTDPWTYGYSMVHSEGGLKIGDAGFKGPPTPEGVVEIAYGVAPEFQGRGYATEAAKALTDFAFHSRLVRVVRAHTLPEPNASMRVLTKCGFHFVGDVVDPEDGPVWRWEKHIAAATHE